MPFPARLISLATAVPPFVLRQEEVRAEAQILFRERSDRITRMLPIYDNAGVETRYSCVPIDWYRSTGGWKNRNTLFIEHAVELLRRAAQDCLARARIPAQRVDTIIAVTTSGVAAPSLDARVMEVLPFRRDVQRLPIFGLGCAGGVLGLARAAAMARAAPGSMVLLLVVELCGLTFRDTDAGKSNIIATALFGDGAAAALVTCDRDASRSPQPGPQQRPQQGPQQGPELAGWGEHTWPDTLDVMGWRVEEDGFGVLFSRAIPAIVRERYGTAVDDFLARHGLGREDLDGTLCHPGGAKVLDALEAVFDLAPGTMTDARAVLRDYGNMSAATVLFVVERALARGLRGRHLVSSLGPGFTAGFLLLEA